MKSPSFCLVPLALLVLCASGCASLTTRIDRALPEGAARKVTGTVTGKFSATQVDAENFSKDGKVVTADKLHIRHSNAWVPLIELTIEGYTRVRDDKPAAAKSK